jgi:hypothetical protein
MSPEAARHDLRPRFAYLQVSVAEKMKCYRSCCVFFASMVFASLLHAKEPRPAGMNCDLSAPPPGAGEEIRAGGKLLVYPRARDIVVTYSGCQAIWSAAGGDWQLVSLVLVEIGNPVRVWSAAPGEQPGERCKYNVGKLVAGDPQQCLAPGLLLMKSLPPGCVQKVQASLASKQAWPSECVYE